MTRPSCFMRKFLIALLILCFSFAAFVWWASRPGVSPEEFPPSQIVKFFKPPDVANAPAPTELKIVTYNIGYASGDKNNRPVELTKAEVEGNLGHMAAVLKGLDPDLVCLQEVDFRASRTFRINEMEFLAKALEMPYGAYAVTWNKRYLPWPYFPFQYQFGQILSGQVILSRYPIESQDLLTFEKPPSNPFWYNWFYLERIVQRVTVRLDNRKMDLYNVHLEAYDKPTRLIQARALGEWVKSGAETLKIVAGDFNSVSVHRPDLPTGEIKEMEEGGQSLREFMKITHLANAEENPPFFSIPSWDPIKKIDHLFYDPEMMKLVSVGTVKTSQASDHLPVWAVMKM